MHLSARGAVKFMCLRGLSGSFHLVAPSFRAASAHKSTDRHAKNPPRSSTAAAWILAGKVGETSVHVLTSTSGAARGYWDEGYWREMAGLVMNICPLHCLL